MEKKTAKSCVKTGLYCGGGIFRFFIVRYQPSLKSCTIWLAVTLDLFYVLFERWNTYKPSVDYENKNNFTSYSIISVSILYG